MPVRDWPHPSPQTLRFDLLSIIDSLATALDLVGHDSGSLFSAHTRRVSYIALTLYEELGGDPGQRNTLYISALIHDAGIVSDRLRHNVSHIDWQETNDHAVTGYGLLSRSRLLQPVAQVVLNHHDLWQGPNASGLVGEAIPLFSRIISLADRVAIMIYDDRYVLDQRVEILDRIRKLAGIKFDPALVDCLCGVGERECFWLDIVSGSLRERILDQFNVRGPACSLEELRSLADVFAGVIDMKSPFTLEHSHGVARVAVELARRSGAPATEQALMEVAGLLHDIGKVSIPDAILEKPGPLTEAEFQIMKRHVYETYNVLRRVPGLAEVSKWAAFHHERLNGNGYPFHVKGDGLSLGSRIMAASDIFQALHQNRPYRPALSRTQVLAELERQVHDGAIDGEIVALLREDYGFFQNLALLTPPSS